MVASGQPSAYFSSSTSPMTSSFTPKIMNSSNKKTTTTPAVSSSDFSSSPPEGRSAEGGSIGGATAATSTAAGGGGGGGRREESTTTTTTTSSNNNNPLPGFFELGKSPPRGKNSSGILASALSGGGGTTTVVATPLPKNPRDTATYEMSNVITTTTTTTGGVDYTYISSMAAAASSTSTTGGGNNTPLSSNTAIHTNHTSSSSAATTTTTTTTNKLQRRLQKQQQQQQQQQQHTITGGGSVKSANSWTSWGYGGGGGGGNNKNGRSSIGGSGRSYKGDILPPLKKPSVSSTTTTTITTTTSAVVGAAAVTGRGGSGGGGGGASSIGGGGGGVGGNNNNNNKSTAVAGATAAAAAARKVNHPPPPPPPSFVLPPGTTSIIVNNNNNSSGINNNNTNLNLSSKSLLPNPTTTAATTITSTNIGSGGGSSGTTIVATPTVISATHDNSTTTTTTPTIATNNTTQQLDDEEQFMFEQRLTHDELGVAIRKISHSGKAQLRYVKCVVLRPLSSSDFFGNEDLLLVNNTNGSDNNGGGMKGGGGSIPGIGTYLEKKNGEASEAAMLAIAHQKSQSSQKQQQQQHTSCDVSVSSSVSSRLMDRIKSVVGGRNTNGTCSSTTTTNNNNNKNMDEEDEDDDNNSLLLHDTVATNSRPSGGNGSTTTSHHHHHPNKSLRALTWGKKNAITIPLDKFTCVRKGKTTERTCRNGASASRLLSIVVGGGSSSWNNDGDGTTYQQQQQESLDIEAPTRLDRDKFASAFARFLGVPLIEEDEHDDERMGRSGVGVGRRKLRTPSITRRKKASLSSNQSSAALSEPSPRNNSITARSSTLIDAAPVQQQVKVRKPTNNTSDTSSLLPALTPNSDEDDADNELAFFNQEDQRKQTITAPPADAARENTTTKTTARSVVSRDANATPVASVTGSSIAMSESARKRISNHATQSESMLEPQDKALMLGASSGAGAVEEQGPTIDALKDDEGDDASHVSSLTGGVDQEIVEELHQAIIELRAELDASRAEAARAVKVAEQAIQSAENCSSSDWNSTVTHKAAEAAAQAQKKSAEAIARARMAEERLSAERKSTAFWRRQAQAAEEEAGSLKTRSAGAEVKQAVLMEELASERRKAARMFATLRQEFVNAEKVHAKELNDEQERRRALEMDLEYVKNELIETKRELQVILDAEKERKDKARGSNRMSLSFRSSRKNSSGGIAAMTPDKVMINNAEDSKIVDDVALGKRTLALESSAQVLRSECDQLRLQSVNEINSLQLQSREWATLADRAVAASRAETEHLREKLAAESAMRLKLLNELQDIRGTVRVYCRPKPGATKPILTIPTQDILIVNEHSRPVSFKFDRVFSPGTSQYEVFSELEEPIVSSLDGFNVTLLAFGQHGSGKTYSILGDRNLDETGSPSLKSHGVQLQALQQLFTIAGHRKGRYKDSFSVTMVEVHNEKLFDLAAGVSAAETDGEVVICETRRANRKGIEETDWRKGKLEIRTNIDGNTVVQGLVSIRINSFEDVCQIWQETIANRLQRLQMQGSDFRSYERNSNVITTIHIQSTNIATGVGTEGRLQFVDMAASNILPTSSENRGRVDGDVVKFSNKSIDAFNDVVDARCQFDRSVPYRNSTLTHLLRDSLEADAKVLLLCCVSSDEADMDNTLGALRFASRIQSVSVGKATKHIIGSKE